MAVMQIKLTCCFLLTAGVALAVDPPIPIFRAAEIDRNVEIGYGVTVADVNGDHKPDILLADKNVIVWYENPSWTKHIMAEKLFFFFQAEDGIRDLYVTGVQTCALPI